MTSSTDARLARLFKDPRRCALDADVRTACTNRGVVNESEIQAAQAEAAKAHEPLWRENPNMGVAEDRELRAARSRAALDGAALAARQAEIVDSLRRPVYRTKAQVEAIVVAEKMTNRASKPILNAQLNAGAGNSAWLARLRLPARAERMAGAAHAALRGSFRAKV